jgi:hypothetical protein
MSDAFSIDSSKPTLRINLNEHPIVIQGVFEMRADILITSYWLHVELGKNI